MERLERKVRREDINVVGKGRLPVVAFGIVAIQGQPGGGAGRGRPCSGLLHGKARGGAHKAAAPRRPSAGGRRACGIQIPLPRSCPPLPRPAPQPNVNTALPRGAGVEIDADVLDRAAAALGADPRCMSATVRIAEAEAAGDGGIAIRRVSTPVARRTRRGGAYFEDAEIFQARVRTSDPSVPALVPRAMLGPNTEFADVVVSLRPAAPDGPGGPGGPAAVPPIVLHANLTGAVQSGGATELVLTVTGTEQAEGGG